MSVASGERPNAPSGPLERLGGPEALRGGGPDPGFELLLLLLLLEGGGVAFEGGGESAVFEPPDPTACPPDPCIGPLGADAVGPDADCELPSVLGDPPEDGFWLRASAYASDVPGKNAITNRSRTSRSIASALRK